MSRRDFIIFVTMVMACAIFILAVILNQPDKPKDGIYHVVCTTEEIVVFDEYVGYSFGIGYIVGTDVKFYESENINCKYIQILLMVE